MQRFRLSCSRGPYLTFADVHERPGTLLDCPVKHDTLAKWAVVIRSHMVRGVEGVQETSQAQAGMHWKQLPSEVLRSFRILREKVGTRGRAKYIRDGKERNGTESGHAVLTLWNELKVT